MATANKRQDGELSEKILDDVSRQHESVMTSQSTEFFLPDQCKKERIRKSPILPTTTPPKVSMTTTTWEFPWQQATSNQICSICYHFVFRSLQETGDSEQSTECSYARRSDSIHQGFSQKKTSFKAKDVL